MASQYASHAIIKFTFKAYLLPIINSKCKEGELSKVAIKSRTSTSWFFFIPCYHSLSCYSYRLVEGRRLLPYQNLGSRLQHTLLSQCLKQAHPRHNFRRVNTSDLSPYPWKRVFLNAACFACSRITRGSCGWYRGWAEQIRWLNLYYLQARPGRPQLLERQLDSGDARR